MNKLYEKLAKTPSKKRGMRQAMLKTTINELVEQSQINWWNKQRTFTVNIILFENVFNIAWEI